MNNNNTLSKPEQVRISIDVGDADSTRTKMCGTDRAARLYFILLSSLSVVVFGVICSGFIVADLSIVTSAVCATGMVWIFVFSLIGTLVFVSLAVGVIYSVRSGKNPRKNLLLVVTQVIGHLFLLSWTIYGLVLHFGDNIRTQCGTNLIVEGRLQSLFYVLLIVVGYMVTGAAAK